MKTRVLVVDDSPSALLALRRMLAESDELEVVGEARTGADALALAESLRPDLVTMDVYLGGQDGVDAARAILARVPTRVVMVTGLDAGRADVAFRALAVGALDVLGKPPPDDGPTSQHQRRRFLAALTALARVGIISRRTRASSAPPASRPPSSPGPLVLLGASTGGPAALAGLLAALPAPFPAPIVIVQHIEPAHVGAFAEWLGQTGHQTRVVDGPVAASRGIVFVAGGDAHLRLEPGDVLTPRTGPPRGFHLPSIDELFESVVPLHPRRAFAALLSGMGEDGAAGLRALERSGATTVVQSVDSCVVPGMPTAALRLGAARLQLAPAEIAAAARRFAAAPHLHPPDVDPR